ncbi:MAG TPA: hypothetical protein VL171_16310 [Verrucomicrobiae bacterium]|nr:hypothetical protein [Verrucomicrobiae bacterium]
MSSAAARRWQQKFLPALLGVALLVFVGYSWKCFRLSASANGYYRGNLQDQLNAFTAGLNFAHCGFLKLHFLPYHHEYRADCLFASKPYTHLLIGSQVISGVLQRLGIHQFTSQRLVLYILSVFSVIFWWKSCQLLAAEGGITAEHAMPKIAVALILASPWLIYWAGNLHTWTYSDFFAALGLWLILSGRKWQYGICVFLAAFFDWELIIFFSVLGAFRLYQEYRTHPQALWHLSAWFAVFVLAPVCAVGLMLLMNTGYFGNVAGAVHDLTDAAAVRMGLAGAAYTFSGHAAKFLFAVLWYYGSSVLVLAVIGIRQCWKQATPWPIVILIAGLLWQLVFRQHSFVHAYTARILGPGVFICAAVGGVTLLSHPIPRWRVCGGVLLLLGVLRLPLGAEVSENPVGLYFWQKAVHSTDSATLGWVLSGVRSTFEHCLGKKALIDELASRSDVPKGLDAYMFVGPNGQFVLAKEDDQRMLDARNLPPALTPHLTKSEPAYTDKSNALDSMTTTPATIAIKGRPSRIRGLLLTLYLRLI